MWKKHLEILLRCWVFLETRNSPRPPPPLWRLIWPAGFGAWRLNLAFSPRVRVAKSRRRAGRGGDLGSPLAGFSPNTGISFWLFLQSYLTSGPFSCWYFLLLKQRFFWYYFSHQVMAILCCVDQKAASAAHFWWLFPSQLRVNMTTLVLCKTWVGCWEVGG